jgi:hypothetical protein
MSKPILLAALLAAIPSFGAQAPVSSCLVAESPNTYNCGPTGPNVPTPQPPACWLYPILCI